MEKKEATAATVLTGADNNTRILGLSGEELVQMPFTAIPEATTEGKGLMSKSDKAFISMLGMRIPAGYTLITKNGTPHWYQNAFILSGVGAPSSGALPVFSVVNKNNIAPAVTHIGGDKSVAGYKLFYKPAVDGQEFWVYLADAETPCKAIHLSGAGSYPLSSQGTRPDGLIEITTISPISLLSNRNSEAFTPPPENAGIQAIHGTKTLADESPGAVGPTLAQIAAKQAEIESRLSKLEGGPGGK